MIWARAAHVEHMGNSITRGRTKEQKNKEISNYIVLIFLESIQL